MFNLDLTEENLYTTYIDNEQTSTHSSLIFGLRELNSTEMIDYCIKNFSIVNSFNINEGNNFTSDFELRIYTSGCYYLDQYNSWQSDGLLVSFIFLKEKIF
jgi:hypothetical protein